MALSQHLQSVFILEISDSWIWNIDLLPLSRSNLLWMIWREMILAMLWMSIQLFGWIVIPRKFSCESLIIVLSILLTVFNVICHTWFSLSSYYISHTHFETAAHLFIHCTFTSCFWRYILDAFGWSVVLFQNLFDNLSSLLVATLLLVRRKSFGWQSFGLSFVRAEQVSFS